VAASDAQDRAAPSNNHGPGIDLYAPGVAVTGPWSTNDTATVTISGAASPFRRRRRRPLPGRVPTATPAQVSSIW